MGDFTGWRRPRVGPMTEAVLSVTSWSSRYRGRLEAEVILAAVVAVVAFVLAALVSAAARGHVPSIVLGAFFLLVVVVVARFGGILYALPVGVVCVEAFDWYFLPPLRALDAATVLVLALFIAMSILVGTFTTRAGRRAAASNEARGMLAEEQAALRRVATLVAEGAPPDHLYAVVAEEIAHVLNVPGVTLDRFEPDGATVVLAGWHETGELVWKVGSRWPLDGPSVAATIWRTGQPAQMDGYSGLPGTIASFFQEHPKARIIGVPIIVDGKVWGMVGAGSNYGEAVPIDTEARLVRFTALVATAISNMEARDSLRTLAEEQAALRRVATLVAEGTTPTRLFAAAVEEIAHVMDVPTVALERFEPDARLTVLATWGDAGSGLGAESLAAEVRQTGSPVRIDADSSTVGVPIIVDGTVWGVLRAGGAAPADGLPADFEARLARFTDLVAIAISNAETRTELIASRARVVAAGDETRRRLERDLHDGIQQRLVSLALRARATAATTPPPPDEVQDELSKLADGLGDALDELREIARGIHPAILAEAGLGPALRIVARRCAVPVTLYLELDARVEESLEAAAYYVASEAVTNAAKHAQATAIELRADSRNGMLVLSIRDDGVGGADPGRGSGIIGLKDRVEALGGQLSLTSLPGDGTTLHVQLPVDPARGVSREPQAFAGSPPPTASAWE